MSDGLTHPAHSHGTAPDTHPRASWRRGVLRVVLVLALFAVGGVGGGYAWRYLWTPPQGEARDGAWVPTPVELGLQGDFSAVGWYVVVASALGLVLGVVTALVMARMEIVALAVAVAGSALAAWLVLTTGERLSPPDPERVAAQAPDGAPIPGDLQLDGWTPLLACPVGTLLGLSVTLLLAPGPRGGGRAAQAAPQPLPGTWA